MIRQESGAQSSAGFVVRAAGLVLTMIMFLAPLVYTAGKTDEKLDTLSHRVASIDSSVTTMTTTLAVLAENQKRFDVMRDEITRLRDELDSLRLEFGRVRGVK